MNYKHNYTIIINLLSILTLLVTFSCSDNKNVLMEKELPELLGTGTTIQIAPVEAWREKQENFTGNIKLKTDLGNNFPETLTISKEDRGRKRIRNLQVNETGWHRIKVEGNNISGISNYLVVTNEKPLQSLYYGDMHVHTLDCDGTADILEHYDYAPNVAGLDFGSVSSHAEYFGSKEAWDRYLEETTKANKPGEFITFPGYEWAQEGHTNVYFLAEEDAVLVWGEKRMRERGYPEDDPQFFVGARNEHEFLEQYLNNRHLKLIAD